MRNVKISAYGCYVPPKLLTNQDLEKMVNTNNEWILERTGIRERHIAGPEMATSDMAVEAANAALAQRRGHLASAMDEEVDGLKKHLIDPLCEVEDRLSLNPQYPFGLLNYHCGHSLLDQSS